MTPVEGEGGPSHDPAMEWRVARLEEDSREMRAGIRALRDGLDSFRTEVLATIATSREDVLARISGVERDVLARVSGLEKDVLAKVSGVEKDVLAKMSGVEREVSELKGRVSQLPSTWVMLTGMLTIMSGLAALVFAITRASIRV